MVTSVLELEKGSYVLRVEVERAVGEDEVKYTLGGDGWDGVLAGAGIARFCL
jgi:hypothetical protein